VTAGGLWRPAALAWAAGVLTTVAIGACHQGAPSGERAFRVDSAIANAIGEGSRPRAEHPTERAPRPPTRARALPTPPPAAPPVPVTQQSPVSAAPSSSQRPVQTSPSVAPLAAPGSGAPPSSTQPQGAAAFRAWASDSGPERVLVQIQIGRAASRTVVAYRVGMQALIPAATLLELGEQSSHTSPEGRLEATMEPGHVSLVIDARADTMRLGDRHIPVAANDRFFKDGELYVAAAPLGSLFGTQALVDWQDLTVTFVDADKFPIGRRLAQEALRNAFLAQRAAQRTQSTILPPDRPEVDGLVIDYSLLAAGQQPLNGGAYSLGVGADVLGGSLVAAAQSVGPTSGGQALGTASWTGVWDDHEWLKQLQFGDGVTTGPDSRTERGILITNAPYLRPTSLGMATYEGQLDSGWTVEAYQAGRLVALDSTNSRGAFGVSLPIGYGENPVDFVAYGPGGQVVQMNQTYFALNDALPVGDFEYGVTAGQCTEGLACRATANADLHYGLSSRITVRGGVDQYWRDSVSDRTYPYAAIVAMPTNAVSVSLLGVGGSSAGGTIQFEPSLNLQAAASYTGYVPDSAPALPVGGLRSNWTLSAFLRPIPSASFFYFNGLVSGTETDAETITRAMLQGSVQVHGVRVQPYVRVERDSLIGSPSTTEPYAGVDLFVLPQPSLGAILGSVWWRAHVEQQLNGALQAVQVLADRPVSSALTLELGVAMQQGTPGLTYTGQLITNLPSMRALTSVSAPTTGTTSGSQYVQGSVIWDRSRGNVSYAQGPSLERAGIVGRVFIDENRDGRWEPGEPLIAGARVLVGSMSATTDSNGLFRVWNLVPFDTVTVALDTLSLESPLLVPAFATAQLEPGPNRYRTIDIPVDRATVLEGRVVEAGPQGDEGVPGVELILVDRRTRAQRHFSTFSDGGFYVLGVIPDDYDLMVDPRTLAALGATAAPTRVSVGARGAPSVRVVVVRH
jgi:hypothetical protein